MSFSFPLSAFRCHPGGHSNHVGGTARVGHFNKNVSVDILYISFSSLYDCDIKKK